MFICTSKGSMLLRGIPSTTFKVVNVARLMDSIKLAPSIEGEDVDAILVTSDDVNSKVLYNKFMEALKEKHPEIVVLYINKKAKSKGEETIPHVNYVLVKPNNDVLRATIAEIISNNNRKAVKNIEEEVAENEDTPAFVSGKAEAGALKVEEEPTAAEALDLSGLSKTTESAPTTPETKGGYVDEVMASAEKTREENVKAIMDEDTGYKPAKISAPDAEHIHVVYGQSASTAELTQLLNDISLETIIQDIAENSQEYGKLSDRISTLSVSIDRIMSVEDRTSTEEKLRRVRALVFERTNCVSAQATVIEQYIEKIIMSVTKEATRAVTSRVEELNRALVEAKPDASTLGSADIIQFKENRTNALVELDMFLEELLAIETGLRKLGTDAVSLFVRETNEITGKLSTDDDLRRNLSPIMPESTLESVKSLYGKLLEMPDEYKALANVIRTTKSLIHKVLDCDSRLIEELERATERLSLSNVSRAATARNIAGRTMRVFIGAPNSGRSIVPYIFAKMHARQNANVLYLNLCDEGALASYGVKSVTLGEFILNPIREDISVVCGKLDTATPIEEVVGAVQKAEKFYSVIYVVVPEDNEEAIEIFTDTAVAAYIVCDPADSNIVLQSAILAKLMNKVCLKSVVFNNVHKVIGKLVDAFGITETSGVTCFNIKHIDAVVAASIEGEDPSYFPSVHTTFKMLEKYV